MAIIEWHAALATVGVLPAILVAWLVWRRHGRSLEAAAGVPCQPDEPEYWEQVGAIPTRECEP